MEESERTDGWEEAVQHILELGKMEYGNKEVMRQLGQMVGAYWLGLLDSGLTIEQAGWPFYWALMAVMRGRKEGLL